MQLGGIALLVLLVVLMIWEFSARAIKVNAVCFCEQVRELMEVLQLAEEGDLNGVFYGRHFTIEYTEKNEKSFFFQMDLAVATVLDQYDKIANRESNFTENDWEFIQDNFHDFENLQVQLRNFKWKRGLL